MTLSFGTLTLRFRQDTTGPTASPSTGYLTFGSTRLGALARRPDSQDFVPYLWPAAAVPFAAMTTTIPRQAISGGETGVHAATARSNGIRHRGGQARAWRGICALGDGSQSLDRAL